MLNVYTLISTTNNCYNIIIIMFKCFNKGPYHTKSLTKDPTTRFNMM